ncbi:MAG: GNAT family N-acetyltransferase [Fibrobacter sp.]|nr:GNAT family N-acetyltransferase [Fibrobacter sp.]MCR5379114.1 GNAT family N-acetyltransferase [Fibrobacter sp.]
MPIRKMTESDLPQVLALQRELAFQDWNEKQFSAELRAGYALCVVYTAEPKDCAAPDCIAPEADKILGYAVFHMMGADSELLSIAASPSVQRQGIGTALLNAGLAQLDFAAGDKMFLEVREGNAKARRFYEKHHFTAFSERKNYYADGENAILYQR